MWTWCLRAFSSQRRRRTRTRLLDAPAVDTIDSHSEHDGEVQLIPSKDTQFPCVVTWTDAQGRSLTTVSADRLRAVKLSPGQYSASLVDATGKMSEIVTAHVRPIDRPRIKRYKVHRHASSDLARDAVVEAIVDGGADASRLTFMWSNGRTVRGTGVLRNVRPGTYCAVVVACDDEACASEHASEPVVVDISTSNPGGSGESSSLDGDDDVKVAADVARTIAEAASAM